MDGPRGAVTHAFVVPTMLARIVAAMEADPSLRVPTLRHLAYGGSPHARPRARARAAPLPRHGLRQRVRPHRDEQHRRVLGPDDHRIAHESDDPPCGPGSRRSGDRCRASRSSSSPRRHGRACRASTGEMHIRGAQVSGEYVGCTSHRDDDGWLHTGDRGWVDAEGYVFVEGRGDDTIIRGGENLSPAEIEDTLLRHPAVATRGGGRSARRGVGREGRRDGDDGARGDRRRRGAPGLGARAARLDQDPRGRRRSRRSSPRPRPARSCAAGSARTSRTTDWMCRPANAGQPAACASRCARVISSGNRLCEIASS